MKNKMLLLTALAVGFGVNAMGSVMFSWVPSSDSLKDKDGNNISTGNATVLTFLSSDANVNFNKDIQLQTTYSDDFLLVVEENLQSGGYTTEKDIPRGAAGIGAGSYVGLYAYAVALNLPYATYQALGATDAIRLGAVPAGTWMGFMATTQGPLTQHDIQPIPAPNQNLNGGSIQTSHPVIPEPGAVMLMGLGFAALFAARRKINR